MKRYLTFLLMVPVAIAAAESTPSTNKTEKAEVSIFPDKNLEKAVRKFVF